MGIINVIENHEIDLSVVSAVNDRFAPHFPTPFWVKLRTTGFCMRNNPNLTDEQIVRLTSGNFKVSSKVVDNDQLVAGLEAAGFIVTASWTDGVFNQVVFDVPSNLV